MLVGGRVNEAAGSTIGEQKGDGPEALGRRARAFCSRTSATGPALGLRPDHGDSGNEAQRGSSAEPSHANSSPRAVTLARRHATTISPMARFVRMMVGLWCHPKHGDPTFVGRGSPVGWV